MSQSLSMVYVHAVFSTKDRIPNLDAPNTRDEVWAYLSGTSAHMGCPAILTGGMADHVHVLFRMGRDITQSDWVRDIKRSSSIWVKETYPHLSDFHWQGGYGIFSVSPSNLDSVREYIRTQEAHHRTMDFKEELRALLRKHGLEWDERYIWE